MSSIRTVVERKGFQKYKLLKWIKKENIFQFGIYIKTNFVHKLNIGTLL